MCEWYKMDDLRLKRVKKVFDIVEFMGGQRVTPK